MRRIGLLSLLVLTACGGGSSVVSLVVDAQDVPAQDAFGDLAEPGDLNADAGGHDGVVEADEWGFDAGSDLPFVECEPGTGCFLDPCQANAECQSGYCVEHLGAGVCTRACQDECAPGWSCQQVAGTEPDVVFICVSDFANLCKPCGAPADCKSVGGVDDACIDYGGEGSFCGGNCATSDDCPWGFSCVDSVSVGGAQLKQCIADAGECPCTAKSVNLGLATPCTVENEFGACVGQRLCTADGLSACDAPAPAPETCNGQDDDCDGEVDEPGYVDGEYLTLCDDGNDCTQDLCNGAQGCAHEILADGECKDGDPCTVGDHCDDGVCEGSPVLCDDSNPCTDDSCDGLGGCQFEPNAADCNDDDPCTLGDTCKAGSCVGEAIDCQCQVDADCLALEDGDLCNGILYCNTEKVPFTCQVVPDSPVDCPLPEPGPDAACQVSLCDPETGQCSVGAANEGFACNDGDDCTLGDTCAGGECLAAGTVACNDNNDCTSDACDPAVGCVFTPQAGDCDDGLLCTTGDHCVAGKCLPGPPLDCGDGNPCTFDACGPNGCFHQAQDGACDDGNPCTINDSCAAGVCVAGATVNCNDNNPCTADACGDQGECLHVPQGGACDDGNACTVGDGCSDGGCAHAGLLDCDDDNPCTNDSCNPATGCVHFLNQAPCNDGDTCTTNDVCSLGECTGSGQLACNDNNPCTDDTCVPDLGCVFTPNTESCDDGSACSLNDVCKNGWCMPGPAPICDDGNLCTTDGCDPELGCTFTNNSAPCDDGDACTISDACAQGACAGGPPLNCDDANPCTDDACDGESGCLHAPNSASCEDGNLCTLNDQCDGGLCVAGPDAPVCNDNNLCTDDACVPEFGCIAINNSAPCDDGNACTDGDTCADGQCAPGGPLDCPGDDNTCTTDSCDAEQGCLYTPLPDCCGNGVLDDGEMCDDGNQADGDGCSSDCQSNGVMAFGEWRPAMKCGDFQNLGPSYLKFCFQLKGQTLCTGQHDQGNVQCFDEANGIRFVYDWAATWPMRFTKGTQDCRNYHPTYLQNFAHAIGYANFQILQQKSGNSCERTWINDSGLFQQTSGDSNANLPYEIRYWN